MTTALSERERMLAAYQAELERKGPSPAEAEMDRLCSINADLETKIARLRAELEATRDELEATRTRERKLEADIAEMFRARARNAGV
jgi:outer membrane murein-binding lipoprotein Lpp